MATRTRRNHSPLFKSKIGLAAIKDEHTLAELAKRFDLHSYQSAIWREQLLACAAGVFEQEKVSESTLNNDFLKGSFNKVGLLNAKR